MPATVRPADRRSLTQDQARVLLSVAVGHRLEGLFVTGLMLGLRPGELTDLRWVDVDLEVGRVAVQGSMKRERSGLRLGETKTPKSRRTLTIPSSVAATLEAHRARQLEEQTRARDVWVDTGLVFTTEIGTPLDPANLRHGFGRLTEKAGLGHWTPNETTPFDRVVALRRRGRLGLSPTSSATCQPGCSSSTTGTRYGRPSTHTSTSCPLCSERPSHPHPYGGVRSRPAALLQWLLHPGPAALPPGPPGPGYSLVRDGGGEENRTPEPLACHASALPTELRPQMVNNTLPSSGRPPSSLMVMTHRHRRGTRSRSSRLSIPVVSAHSARCCRAFSPSRLGIPALERRVRRYSTRLTRVVRGSPKRAAASA